MEMIAQGLKAMGGYTARNLSFDGVKYETIEHELTENQKAIYDELARSWQVVLQNIHAALQATGVIGQSHREANNPQRQRQKECHGRVLGCTSAVFQPDHYVHADPDSHQGHREEPRRRPLSRGAAREHQRGADRPGDGQTGGGRTLNDLDLTPREGLMNYLEHSFPVQQYEEYTDDNGNIRSRPVLDSNGNPVINREAVAMRDALLRRLGMMRVPDAGLT